MASRASQYVWRVVGDRERRQDEGEEMSLAEFFRAVPRLNAASIFDLLVAIVDHLSDVKVFKVGEVRMTVYVVGTTADGNRAGVKTVVVET